jgi:pyruvate/2-oxoglutarate dehydrogenase complex dihydrolipoamide acyltransferase (E2) component
MSNAKKTMYHSEAAKLGPVQCLIKTDVQQSKFQGKPNYLMLEVAGVERNYNCENAAVEAALRGRAGQNVMLEFTGSRDEAKVKVLAAGQPQEQQTAPQAPQGAQSPPPPQTPTPAPIASPAASQTAKTPQYDTWATIGHRIVQSGNLLQAVERYVEKVYKPAMAELGVQLDPVGQQARVTTLFIEYCRKWPTMSVPLTQCPAQKDGGAQ